MATVENAVRKIMVKLTLDDYWKIEKYFYIFGHWPKTFLFEKVQFFMPKEMWKFVSRQKTKLF